MATTPRPLLWQNIIEIGTANEPNMTAQNSEGNGKIFYVKNNNLYERNVAVTQGHWQNMTVGSENQISSLILKDCSTDQAIANDVYSLGVCEAEEEGKPDKLYLIKDELLTGVHIEIPIKTLL